jgi:hypothetical protein
MEILGDRKFVEIPGDATHELPPLLVREAPAVRRLDRVVGMASRVVEQEDLVPSLPLDSLVSEGEVDRRKMDMALNLVELYLSLVRQWNWGDGIVEWIRQCEITFEHSRELRSLLRPDVWPHAGRCSFVTLLEDKAVRADGVDLEKAVGLRLTFRQPPPLEVFSDQFLFYLNGSVANTAYRTWANLSPEPVSSLPPERFSVQVVSM